MKRINFQTIIVFLASYTLIHLMLIGILSFFSAYLTGMFVFLTIITATVISAGFYKKKNAHPISRQEIILFVVIFTTIAFVIEYFSSNYFKVNQPNVFMLIFAPFFVWHPLRLITKN